MNDLTPSAESAAAPAALPPVRFTVKDFEVDPNNQDSVTNRLVRRLLKSTGAKMQKKFSHLVHPETGERPQIVIHIENPGKPSIQCKLVTDSAPLRDWLKGQGVVIEDVSVEAAA